MKPTQLGRTAIETERVLLGLIRVGRGVAAELLRRAKMSFDGVRQEIRARTSGRENPDVSRDSVQRAGPRSHRADPARSRRIKKYFE
jgi:ATP-dependent Clp protease ATP-binding subunit ClpA